MGIIGGSGVGGCNGGDKEPPNWELKSETPISNNNSSRRYHSDNIVVIGGQVFHREDAIPEITQEQIATAHMPDMQKKQTRFVLIAPTENPLINLAITWDDQRKCITVESPELGKRERTIPYKILEQ